MMIRDVVAILAAYALGCVCSGYYIVRVLTGEDIRSRGSGSVGAKNVGRVLGGRWSFATFTLDLLKGVAAVVSARLIGADGYGIALAALAVTAGHVWPVQLKFHGGKGVAVALGSMFAVDWVFMTGFAILYMFLFSFLPRFTMVGLMVVASSPFLAWAMGRDLTVIASSLLIALVLFFSHRKNIRTALADQERRDEKKEAEKKPPVSLDGEAVINNTELVFKVATEDWEMDQIHRLNYKTFVEEIPQHERNLDGRLVDKFHAENTYVVCLHGDRVVGMICLRSKRPFSLDAKLENLDSYLPPGRNICEMRLLSVEKEYRSTHVFFGLMRVLSDLAMTRGHDMTVISGTLRQVKLYRHLGCLPFGPVLGTGEARFQGMYLTLENFEKASKRFIRSKRAASELVNLLPGPVGISSHVRAVFADAPISHRSAVFMDDFQALKQKLCALVNAPRVELMMGSGSLANDAVAAQLSILGDPGLILCNGEFGNRLIDQGTRHGLKYNTVTKEWGEPILKDDILAALDLNPGARWIWGVHNETSTGVLLNLDMVKTVAKERGLKVCLDSISSIGLVPVDLSGVYLASGVSGKGLGSYPGVSMVYYDRPIEQATGAGGGPRLPRYLDLGYYAKCEGVPFTISSNLVYALKAAVDHFDPAKRFAHLADMGAWLRAELRAMDFRILAPDEHACPPVITIVPPEGVNALRMGERLESAGYLLSYRSEYLVKRNFIQICLMGECTKELVAPVLIIMKGFSPRAGELPSAVTLSRLLAKAN
jgi:acyl-phosphate glycerol 3-phosphate acyltransferase